MKKMDVMRTWMAGIAALAAPAAAQQGQGTGSRVTRSEAVHACAGTVRDQATGGCFGASSVPMQGMLYPLGPDFFLDAAGWHLADPLETQGDISCNALEAGGNHVGAAGIGMGTSSLAADLHIRRNGPVEVLLQADADDDNFFEQPRIRFSSFGGVAQAFIGQQDGTTHLSLRNLTSVGGMNFDLHTSSSDSWEFRRRASVATDVEARLRFNGNLELDGSVSSPAADLAEFYPVVGAVEPGDVVAFVDGGPAVERAHAGARGRLAGVVSSRPAFVMGLSYTREDEPGLEPGAFVSADLAQPIPDPAVLHEIAVNRRAPLALSGRIPCKVSAENGPIEVGDLLTISSLPGHAMKATGSGAVVGTAMEAWASGEGTILVLANLGWFSPTERLERDVAYLLTEVERLSQELEELSLTEPRSGTAGRGR